MDTTPSNSATSEIAATGGAAPETSMTTEAFLGMQVLGDDQARIEMKNHLLGGGSGSLFGGVGVAAGILEVERITGKSPVYMTCQFASTVVPPSVLTLTTELLAQGRTVNQARITGTSEGRTILAMVGASGSRKEEHRGNWQTMPGAPAPEDLASLQRHVDTVSLHDFVDVRMARGAFGFAPPEADGAGTYSGDGSTLFWARMPEVQHDAAALALIADYLPSAVGNAMQTRMFCSSLDNTIRFVAPIEPDPRSDWILCESHVEFVAAGFAVNRGLLWRRDGTLLAAASQSVTAATPRD